ncbi:MAG: hypothetical protein V7679_14360 [Parasphingorhabdus sp.]
MAAVILAMSLLAASSTWLDGAEWGKPFSVTFDCRLAKVSSDWTGNLKATANFSEGAVGSQPFRLEVAADSDVLAGFTEQQKPSAHSGRLRVYSENLILQFPFNQSTKIGSKSYPSVIMGFKADDQDAGDLVMAGPCKVSSMEAANS